MFGQSYLSPQTLVRQLSSLDAQLGTTLNWPNPSVRNKNMNSVKPADSILDLCLLTAGSLWHFWSKKHGDIYKPSAERGCDFTGDMNDHRLRCYLDPLGWEDPCSSSSFLSGQEL